MMGITQLDAVKKVDRGCTRPHTQDGECDMDGSPSTDRVPFDSVKLYIAPPHRVVTHLHFLSALHVPDDIVAFSGRHLEPLERSTHPSGFPQVAS